MHKYGVGNEDFGLISVQLRKHAATNPAAWFYGKPITLEDHQASRWIVAPALRLLDCCQESDGGVAIVVASMARARQLRQTPVGIFGAVTSMRFNHETITDYYHSADLTQLPIAERVRERLTAACGISPRDTQVAMIYDNFTPQIFLQLEAFGFCGAGEARDYTRDGHLELDGRSPLSPNGGHIGEGYIHGMNLVTEGVRQARGTAANQVAGAELALVGAPAGSAMILAR